MTYFKNFPKIVYTLDEYRTGQIIPDVFRRTKFISELADNYAFYDEHDIGDGETPEITADLFYSDPTLHWVILQANDIIDPRFDWPLDSNNLKRYAEGKYSNISSIHHYEDSTGNIINGNITITSSAEFANFQIGNVITNVSGSGNAFITAKDSSSSINITTYNGGFVSGNQIALSTNSTIVANITTTTVLAGTPVTNLQFEIDENEQKRRIRILKASIVADIINDFESVIKR